MSVKSRQHGNSKRLGQVQRNIVLYPPTPNALSHPPNNACNAMLPIYLKGQKTQHPKMNPSPPKDVAMTTTKKRWGIPRSVNGLSYK